MKDKGALAVLGQMAVAAAVTVIVAAAALTAIARVQWPAYNSSNQLHALTTVGQFGCLAGLLVAGWLWRRGRRLIAHAGALISLSAFSVVTLAMPLGATKLYLFGISVDQQFRTEYLTRLTDTAGPHDMTYYGLPPFYPPGWFWIGGRLAALTGTPAWEMFKPWAITSVAIAVVLALVLWASMIRFEYALIVSTATAAATLAYSPAEPSAAIIAVRRMDRNRRRRRLPRHLRSVLYAAARLCRVHTDVHGDGRRGGTAQMGSAVAALRHRRHRGGHRADRMGPVPGRRSQRPPRRFRHGAALPARRRRRAVLPDAAVH